MVVTPHWPVPLGHKPIDLGLERIITFLERLGNPHHALPPVVHVAGTNGKGSTIAFMRAMLEAAGYRVHVYTSPHLVQFNERIVLAGEMIGDALLEAILSECQHKADGIPLTFFEGTTAAAFLAFSRTQADILLLETGLGGRLDATNVVTPALTVITPISIDHTEFLGNTLLSIAAEKAGIMKPGVPCVLGKQPQEVEALFEEKATALGAALYRHEKEWQVRPTRGGFDYVYNCHSERALATEESPENDGDPSLPLRMTFTLSDLPSPTLYGLHQYGNAGAAITALHCLPSFEVSETALRKGLQDVHHPARLQHLHTGKLAAMLPPSWELWLDGGHNQGGSEVLADVAATWQDKPLYLVVGMLQGKDSERFFASFKGKAVKVLTVPIAGETKAIYPATLAEAARTAGLLAETAPGIPQALGQLTAENHAPARVLVCGSLYLAGTVLVENAL